MYSVPIIYAKSNPLVTLEKHVEDCITIFEQIKNCIPNLPVGDASSFWNTVRCSIVFHDMGKSHRDFQKLLVGERNKWNQQRHEVFSIPYVFAMSTDIIDKSLVSYSIIGHHKALKEIVNVVGALYREEKDEFDLFEESINIGAYKKGVVSTDEQYCKSLASKYGFKVGKLSFEDIYKYVLLEYSHNDTDKYSDRIKKILLVGALKQCDHLASAGIKKIARIQLSRFNFLYQNELYYHQKTANNTTANTLLIAPTGAGKTESALLWVENGYKVNAEGRIFYVLPYTASINAMYERFTKCFESEEEAIVGMMHGKLAQYLENRIEQKSSESILNIINDFKTIVSPLKIVTPFQLLKNLFLIKGYEKGIFEWCGGYFIFDEIHAYDVSLFAQIVVLIEFVSQKLGAHVFIMSATIPSYMTRELLSVMKSPLVIKAENAFYNRLKRHRVVVRDGLLREYIEEIRKDLAQQKKVIVVCNTIEEAQYVYGKFIDIPKEEKLLLHGAFNSNDRSNVEKRLNSSDDIKLLVGTQAIEVSLDIDYDVIYTEPAPLDALLQRFGRVNRKCKKDYCPCYVFTNRKDSDKYVYTNEEVINRTIHILKDNYNRNNGIILEKDIQELIDYVYPSWDVEEKKMYDCSRSLFETAISSMSALNADYIKEKEFYDQFDGVNVLPVSLLKEYVELMANFEFIRAEGLFVSISKGRVMRLKREESLSSEHLIIEYSDNKLFDKTVKVIKRKYSKEYGLLINEEETEGQFENQCL